MVRSCCAHNCTTRDVKETREAGVTFYRIPQNKAKRELWLNTIKRKDFCPSASTVLCSQHFVGGKKSDDPLSPAYTPSIFSFMSSQKKQELEQGLERYEAAKCRRCVKEKTDNHEENLSEEEAAVHVLYQRNILCAANQTDMTGADLDAFEKDYRQRVKEVSDLRGSAKGYPNKDDLSGDDKLLRFYTGLNSFTILMAVFNLVSPTINETSANKLAKFDCFVLTLMKLRLNLSNYDLSFRFGVSESTVCRIFSK